MAQSENQDAPFHRGNYKLKYTPEEEAVVIQFGNQWIPRQGLLSALLGGGITYGLLQNGMISPTYRGLKLIAGGFTAFTIARVFATRRLNRQLRENFPDGYVAQMYYLKDHVDQFQDFIAFANEKKRSRYFGPVRDTSPSLPPQPHTSNKPAQATSDIPGSHTPLPGLDDRFRPQMDGILQGQPPPVEDDQAKKEPKGSYALWRAQKSPLSPEGPPPRTTSLDPPPADPQQHQPRPQSLPYDTFQNPSSYEASPKPHVRQDPSPSKRPVKRNKYGDIIEDE